MKYFLTIVLSFVFLLNTSYASEVFGYDTVGGSTGDGSGHYAICNKYTTTDPGDTISIFYYASGVIDGSKFHRGALYTDGGSTPDELLVESATSTMVSGWNEATIDYELQDDTTYWICTTHDDIVVGHALYKYDVGSLTMSYMYLGSINFSSTWTETGNLPNRTISQYVSFDLAQQSSTPSSTTGTSTMTEFETFLSYYMLFGTIIAGAVVAYKLMI